MKTIDHMDRICCASLSASDQMLPIKYTALKDDPIDRKSIVWFMQHARALLPSGKQGSRQVLGGVII